MLMSTEAKRDIEMKMSQIYILVINKAWNYYQIKLFKIHPSIAI